MPVVEIADAVRVRVPAKINLHLAVGATRPDGFHELTTVFQAVSVYDEVIARAGDGMRLTASGERARGVPVDATNLAWKAAAMLADHVGTDADVLLELHKSIPVAGGMAGGSADAAGALVACAALWRTGSSRVQLAELAARLGSDVAFPLTGGTALGTGRGEQITPVLATGEYHWVFALADFGISTADTYAELDRMRAAGTAPDPIGAPDELLDALRAGDCGRLADALANDLQPAVMSLRPELGDVLEAGVEFGALGGVVSGSGPTCAFLCAHADAARDLAEELDDAKVCGATRVATAPAPGARITG
ncbi:MAG TPA: 4-(cytidine 5'-diphospho)-2-C-methyl-D-erythritol kinase [Jatrophihabitans sp.]|jgi:4-diphosphocytidyl-2-C-methyl-D-erythritol kinase